MTTEHPNKVAEQLAAQLLSDPVAAAQIKEFIKPDDLRRLLDMPTLEDIEEAFERGHEVGYNSGHREGRLEALERNAED